MSERRVLGVALTLLLLSVPARAEDEPAAKPRVPKKPVARGASAHPTVPGLKFLGLSRTGAEEWVRLADRAVMVRIPGGTYLQRPYEGAGTFADPKPVLVKSFFIDKHEVTNRQIEHFLTTPPPALNGALPLPQRLSRSLAADADWEDARDPRHHAPAAIWRAAPGRERYPATVLTGYGAVAFAASVGGRIPTLAEWEKAAGGPYARVYPWGAAVPDETRANFGRPGARGPMPVGSYAAGASPYGVLDMAGNVYERVLAPGRTAPVVIKGGAWLSPHPLNLRVLDMCVQPMGVSERSVGLRLVLDDPEPGRPTWKPAPTPRLRLATDFSEAMEQARERKVPLFLSLHYDTCGQCDRMRAGLMRDPKFIAYLNEHCVVLVGHHPGDASLWATKEKASERPALYAGLDEVDLHSIFRRGLNVVGSFTVSPGNFILDPNLVRPAADAAVHLVPAAELSKWGHDVAGYLRALDVARASMRTRHGEPISRGVWLAAQQAAENAEDDD